MSDGKLYDSDSDDEQLAELVAKAFLKLKINAKKVGRKKVLKQEIDDVVSDMAGGLVYSQDEEKTKPKKPKKADRPKRPPTAYQLYVRHVMPSIKEDNSIAPKDRFAEVGRRWKALSDEEKAKFREAQMGFE